MEINKQKLESKILDLRKQAEILKSVILNAKIEDTDDFVTKSTMSLEFVRITTEMETLSIILEVLL